MTGSDDEQNWFNFIDFIKSGQYMGTRIEAPVQPSRPSRSPIRESQRGEYLSVEGLGILVATYKGLALVTQEDIDCVDKPDGCPIWVLSSRP